MLNHQRTIDFLNESFQQEANVDLTSIDYMENIKQINIDWLRIKSLISARIDVRIYIIRSTLDYICSSLFRNRH